MCKGSIILNIQNVSGKKANKILNFLSLSFVFQKVSNPIYALFIVDW